jgi:hypothetical protein
VARSSGSGVTVSLGALVPNGKGPGLSVAILLISAPQSVAES